MQFSAFCGKFYQKFVQEFPKILNSPVVAKQALENLETKKCNLDYLVVALLCN